MMCLIPGFSWILPMLVPVLGPGLVPRNLDLKLMKELTTDLSKNEVISPFVMTTLMTQVWLAARGATRNEMTPVLGIRGDEFLLGYQDAITDLSSGPSTVSKVFNGVYVKKGFSIKPSYTCTLAAYYLSKVKTFSTAKEGAEAINAAVANTTNNLIPELVTPEALNSALFVLVSALYFKGEWQTRFNRTEPEQFLTASGEKTVNMMKLETNAFYKNMSTYDVICLQYKDPDYSMLLLRPLKRDMTAVKALRDSLDSLDVGDIADQLQNVSVNVAMPRFKMETSYDQLEKVFPKLGIKRLFTSDANLGNMATGKLQVSKIIHKVSIEVTEEGTEAAAAAAAVGYGSAMPVSYTLDRPFFAIVWNCKHRMNMFTAYVGLPESL